MLSPIGGFGVRRFGGWGLGCGLLGGKFGGGFGLGGSFGKYN